MDKEIETKKTKELEGNLERERPFSERQIINAEKTLSKWLHYIIAETGFGKIEVFIDRGKKIIDINPMPSIRVFRD